MKKCKLCQKEAELRESHIIPSFFFKYLKRSSGTGHLRCQQSPNKRIQDGFKEYWLCKACEDLFGNWETQFSNKIFRPLTEHSIFKFSYDTFLLKFSASISWRVLTFLKEKEGLEHLPEGLQQKSEEFLSHLRLFLLGEKEDPGKYHQHIMLLDLVDDHTIQNMPTNINRYFLRNIDIELPYSENECLVFTKLPYMVIFGHIFNINNKNWKNTKINLKKGVLGGNDIIIPGNLFEFMLERAENSRNFENEISEKQKLKIHKDWKANEEQVRQSETYKALNGDIRLFGDRAYD
jgi:hypothetical protein